MKKGKPKVALTEARRRKVLADAKLAERELRMLKDNYIKKEEAERLLFDGGKMVRVSLLNSSFIIASILAEEFYIDKTRLAQRLKDLITDELDNLTKNI